MIDARRQEEKGPPRRPDPVLCEALDYFILAHTLSHYADLGAELEIDADSTDRELDEIVANAELGARDYGYTLTGMRDLAVAVRTYAREVE